MAWAVDSLKERGQTTFGISQALNCPISNQQEPHTQPSISQVPHSIYPSRYVIVTQHPSTPTTRSVSQNDCATVLLACRAAISRHPEAVRMFLLAGFQLHSSGSSGSHGPQHRPLCVSANDLRFTTKSAAPPRCVSDMSCDRPKLCPVHSICPSCRLGRLRRPWG